MRKSLYIILLSIVAVLTLSSLGCSRYSHNGKIDGYWQISTITYKGSNEISTPKTLFICIQIELLQLDNPAPSPKRTGVISYDKKADILSVDFRNGPTDEELYPFGFTANPCVLKVVSATGSKMVRESDIATIECRKF